MAIITTLMAFGLIDVRASRRVRASDSRRSKWRDMNVSPGLIRASSSHRSAAAASPGAAEGEAARPVERTLHGLETAPQRREDLAGRAAGRGLAHDPRGVRPPPPPRRGRRPRAGARARRACCASWRSQAAWGATPSASSTTRRGPGGGHELRSQRSRRRPRQQRLVARPGGGHEDALEAGALGGEGDAPEQREPAQDQVAERGAPGDGLGHHEEEGRPRHGSPAGPHRQATGSRAGSGLPAGERRTGRDAPPRRLESRARASRATHSDASARLPWRGARASGGRDELLGHGVEPLRVMRSRREPGRARPALGRSGALQDEGVVLEAEDAVAPAHVDAVASLVGRPGEEDVGGGARELDGHARGVLDGPLPVTPPLQGRADRGGLLAQPSAEDVEHVPAVVAQHAAARHLRVHAPVRAMLVPGRGRAEAERLPRDVLHRTDGAGGEEPGGARDDRGVMPVVHGVEDAIAPGGRRGEDGQRRRRQHQGLLAQHVQAALEGGRDDPRVARRRRADVDEVERLGGQEVPRRRCSSGRREGDRRPRRAAAGPCPPRPRS